MWKVPLHEFFKPASGPYKLMMPKAAFERACSERLYALQGADAHSAPGLGPQVTTATALIKSTKTKTDAMAAKAKESLKQHRQKKGRARYGQISSDHLGHRASAWSRMLFRGERAPWQMSLVLMVPRAPLGAMLVTLSELKNRRGGAYGRFPTCPAVLPL